MKKYSILSIGILFLMLTVGGIAYGQGGMDDSSGQSGESTMGQEGTSGMGQAGTAGTSGASAVKVDINTASAKELQCVPGMTKTMARDIIKYRDQNGPFSSVDDLTKVKGINESSLNKMRDSLMIGQAGGAAPMGGGQQGTGGMGSEPGGAGETGGMGTDSGGAGETGSGAGSSGY